MRFGKLTRGLLAGVAIAGFASSQAFADGHGDGVKIGMITTLSGGGASLGIDIRDGFLLALDQRQGKLGGVTATVDVVDDARKVGNAKQIATRMIEQDNVDIVTGIVWSNLALAVVPSVTRAGKFYISPNAGPSQLAGKACDPNFFNVAWQNDNLHEGVGQYVQDGGYKKVYMLAPNYPAGKDAIKGFKRFFKGESAGEVYTKLGEVDYATNISQIRASGADAVFFFLPGGMGINFMKQYAQSGLDTPLFGPAFSFDEGILKAVGEAALGVVNTSQWNADIANDANATFVETFIATYGRRPSLYASQGYDAAQLIDSAISAVGGDLSDADAFRAALKAAKFDSPRGDFAFGNNHFPIQNIYARKVVKAEDGGLTNEMVGTVFSAHQDAYAADCKM